MDILSKKQDCCGCHACYNVCPVQAVHMKSDDEGFLYPFIDKDKCIDCGKCKKVCPTLHIPPINPYEEAYACYAADNEEHMSSSSGGVFAVLARQVLKEGGVVCGAAFDESMVLKHILIENESELSKLKGTKYVQSTIGNAYSETKKVLKTGKLALFSGTPCQVAGLKAFLGKEYDNLLTIDLICHGVPSPEVWQDYLRELGGNTKVRYVNFREKTKNSSETYIAYYLEDGTVIKESKAESLYMRGFLQNAFLRPSCFSCSFKGAKRCSDITIGDFWSATEFHPNLANNAGVSAAVIHTDKGKLWFEKIASLLCLEKGTTQEVVHWNECLLASVPTTEKRAEFYVKWKDLPLRDVLQQVAPPHVSQPISKSRQIVAKWKGRIKRILG